MDDALRHQLCRLIAGLVVSDDDLDDREDAFIDRLLARFGIPREQRDSIFPIVDRSEAAAAILSMPRGAQHEALTLLIDAAAADGKIVAEERAYLETVASVLGIDQAGLEARIQAALTRS